MEGISAKNTQCLNKSFSLANGTARIHISHKASMTQLPISVIMPAHNSAKYLPEAVASILSQTFENFEFIIINDASTDETTSILTSLKDPRVIIHNNKQNCGVTKSLNIALNLSKGKYVARMDADDVSLPKRLEAQYNFLENNPGIAMVGGWAEIIDDLGKTIFIDETLTAPTEIRKKIYQANQFYHPSVMFRKELVTSIGGYNTQIPHAQDYELWLRLLTEHNLSNLSEIIIRYRLHPNQISQKKMRKQRLIADKVRGTAYKLHKASDLLPPHTVKPSLDIFSKLCGKPDTIGGDYLTWASTYKEMGRLDEAQALINNAILVSPLSRMAWHEFIHSHLPPTLLKSLRWYFRRFHH